MVKHSIQSGLVLVSMLTLAGSAFGQIGLGGDWTPPTYQAVSLPVALPQFTTLDEKAVRAIQVQLKKPVNVAFDGTPFAEMVAEFQRQSGVNVAIDHEALDELGIGLDMQVNWTATHVPVAVALSDVMKPMGLRYAIREYGIEITSTDEALTHVHARVYEVTDLISRPAPGQPGRVEFDFDTLIDLITASVHPDSWDDVGGDSSISGYPLNNRGTLVIHQMLEVHDEIEALLNTLRRTHRLPAPAEIGGTDLPNVSQISASQPVRDSSTTRRRKEGRSYQLTRPAVVVPERR